MDKFDDLWNDDIDVDLNSLDLTVNVEDRVKKISNHQLSNQNTTDEISSNWLDDAEWDKLDKPTQWRKIISTIENKTTSKYTKAKKTLDYKFDFLTNKLKIAKENDSTKIPSLVAQLYKLKQRYLELRNEEAAETAEVDFMKGRAAGFINSDNYFDFNNHPGAATKVLATDEYEYKPTPTVFK